MSEQLEMVVKDIVNCFGAWTPETTLDEMRSDWNDLFGEVTSSVDASSETIDMGGVPAVRVAASSAAADRAVLYLHGGGYILGSPQSHGDLCRHISQAAQAQVFILDYRLAPEHPFPAAVEDAATAYRWLLDAGFQPQRIAIAGDSAGGGLACATLLAIRENALPRPACAVPLSAWVDLECTGESYVSKADSDPILSREFLMQFGGMYAPPEVAAKPLASPLNGDLKDMPPLLIQVGEREVLLDDSRRLAERAEQAGVDVTLEVEPGQIHVFQLFVDRLDESVPAIERIGAFIRKHTDVEESA